MAAVVAMEVEEARMSASEAKAELKTAMAKRDNLEAEAEAIRSELESPTAQGGPPAGLKTPLVDAEGFPRADLDLFRVRELRHRMACIQTDHKAVMKKIEALLPLALAPGANADVAVESEPRPPAPAETTEVPFVVIKAVAARSPADRAGLIAGDEVLRYGDVTSIDGIKQWTLSHVNETFTVKVRRASMPRPLVLDVTPRAWEGDGILGCHFLPPQSSSSS